ncbi:MAG TPA: VC0807 family protein [Acidimicrobiia bacterium]|nr:VC0807 family protein [Acidimicrobiia bacterium]
MPPLTFEIPRLRALARHALPNIVEATLVPLGLFYTSMWFFGVWGALAAALAWSYAALAVRLLTRRRIPGVLVLGAMAMTVRTVIAVLSGSVFVYFLQPSLGTVSVALLFLVSVPYGRPLAQRLASDFCPLPDTMQQHPSMQVFFARISLLWGFVYLTNAALTVWLLLNESLSTFLLVKTAASFTLTGSAIAFSTWWFIRFMRANGVQVIRAKRLTAGGLAPAVAS